MMALSVLVRWYWPEKVLAICFPALSGGLRPLNMSVSDGDATGNGETGGSAIVAYEATQEKRLVDCAQH